MRWLFQGNPNYYKVIEAIRDFEQLHWTVLDRPLLRSEF